MKYLPFLTAILFVSCQSSETEQENLSEEIASLDTTSTEVDSSTYLYIGMEKFLIQDAPEENILQGIMSTEQYKYKEDSCLANFPTVTRDSSNLIFLLENGDTAVLSDIPLTPESDGLDVQICSFIGEVSNAPYWEIFVMGYEYHYTMLLNKVNGNKKITIGRPVVSPSGKYMMTANEDLEAAYTINGLELFEVGSDSLTKIGRCEISDWGPSNIKWEDDEHLLITQGNYDYENGYQKIYNSVRLSWIKE